MLQVAYGGYHTVSDGVTQFIANPTYYEPGFNIMTPLEIQGNKSDYFYLLLRKRENADGTDFSEIATSDISVTVKDATTGDGIINNLSANILYPDWERNPSGVSPLVLRIVNTINLDSPTTSVRILDIYITDTTDNDFISFRVLVDDEGRYFHYIPIGINAISSRNTFTIMGREAYVRLNGDTDYYVLFSPYAYLAETDKEHSDFSYPIDSVFYKRQRTYNDEGYSFAISSYSHSFVPNVISVMNVSGYSKAAVILVDRICYAHLIEEGENASVTISIDGKLSGISDEFTVNFIT